MAANDRRDHGAPGVFQHLAAGLTVPAVNIDHRDSGGTVHIRYRDLDQLDEIVRRLGTKG